MSDNMEHIADFFKESGHRDRHFEVNEAGWDRLAAALDQKKKRRWLPFWWSLGVVVLLGVGMAFWPMAPIHEPVISQAPKTIQAEPNAEIPTAQQADQKQIFTTTALGNDPIAEADPISETTDKTTSNIVTSTNSAKIIRASEPEVVAVKTDKKVAFNDPVTTEPQLAVGPAESTEMEPVTETKLPDTNTAQLQNSGIVSFTPAQALPNTGEKLITKASLQSITTNSIVQPPNAKKRSARKPYPRPNIQQQTNSAATTMQTMLGARVYGSTVQGEEINAWEGEKIGGRWQIALGVGTIPASYRGVLFYYSTEQIPAVFMTEHTLADGSVIELYADGQNTARGKVTQNFNFYRFALYRDLGKGFGVKGSFLVASINDKTPRSLINQAPNRPNVAYFTSKSRSINLMAELGLQYTFYRRQRFQPYIGLSVFNVMANSYRSEQRFVWPGMGIDEVSSRASSTSSTNFPGYYFEFGMQYLPAPEWSVGPSFIITGTPFVEPQLGFGIEARYRF